MPDVAMLIEWATWMLFRATGHALNKGFSDQRKRRIFSGVRRFDPALEVALSLMCWGMVIAAVT
jgi:hypothetical protein